MKVEIKNHSFAALATKTVSKDHEKYCIFAGIIKNFITMKQLSGVEYTQSAGRHYVHIDLDMYAENPSLQDFLDGLEIEARKKEPAYPFDEVVKKEFERRGKVEFENKG